MFQWVWQSSAWLHFAWQEEALSAVLQCVAKKEALLLGKASATHDAAQQLNTNKCHLKEPDSADYPFNLVIGHPDSEGFAKKMVEIFPEGVWFYQEPMGFIDTMPRLHCGDANEVIYGKEPLGKGLALGSRQGWALPVFDVSM